MQYASQPGLSLLQDIHAGIYFQLKKSYSVDASSLIFQFHEEKNKNRGLDFYKWQKALVLTLITPKTWFLCEKKQILLWYKGEGSLISEPGTAWLM